VSARFLFFAAAVLVAGLVGLLSSGRQPWPLPANAQGQVFDLTTPSEVCGACHQRQYQEWRESWHSKALTSPVYQMMWKVYLMAVKDPDKQTCLACHAPQVGPDPGKIEEVSRQLLSGQIKTEAVGCTACHLVEASLIKPDDPATYNLKQNWRKVIWKPGDTVYGPIRDPVSVPGVHRSEYREVFTKSEFCATCHQWELKPGVPCCTVYEGWKKSKFAVQGMVCQTCHMPEKRNEPAWVGGAPRPRVASHTFKGGRDPEMLKRAAQLEVDVQKVAGKVEATVRLTNVGAAHNFPDG